VGKGMSRRAKGRRACRWAASSATPRSPQDWEQEQEAKEMGQLGPDALFLMSTPVDATPLEKKKKKMARRPRCF